MSPFRRHYAHDTDEYWALALDAALPAMDALRRFAFARNGHSPTASFRPPLAGERRFPDAPTGAPVNALAFLVSGSLRQGPGIGLVYFMTHLQNPGHASHTSSIRPWAVSRTFAPSLRGRMPSPAPASASPFPAPYGRARAPPCPGKSSVVKPRFFAGWPKR